MENTDNTTLSTPPAALKIERHEFDCGDNIEFLVPDNSMEVIKDTESTKNSK